MSPPVQPIPPPGTRVQGWARQRQSSSSVFENSLMETLHMCMCVLCSGTLHTSHHTRACAPHAQHPACITLHMCSGTLHASHHTSVCMPYAQARCTHHTTPVVHALCSGTQHALHARLVILGFRAGKSRCSSPAAWSPLWGCLGAVEVAVGVGVYPPVCVHACMHVCVLLLWHPFQSSHALDGRMPAGWLARPFRAPKDLHSAALRLLHMEVGVLLS